MLTKSGSTIARAATIMFLAGLFSALGVVVQAQPSESPASIYGSEGAGSSTPKDTDAAAKKPLTVEEKLNLLQQLIEQQNARLNQLQQTVEQQQETIRYHNICSTRARRNDVMGLRVGNKIQDQV